MLITDGRITLNVSKGAYNTIYAKVGFSPVPTTKAPLEDMHKDKSTEADKEITELEETPLEDMSFEQLKTYAKHLGINANGFKSRTQLIKIIEEAQEDDDDE